jgi:iron-sulfur cluster assembly accessory protein
MNPIINITKSAWGKLGQITKSKGGYAFLFSASSGGCNGFNYDLSTIDKKEFNDLIKPNILEYEDIKFAIDPLAEMYLLGTTIDYVKEDYSKNIFESKFVFIPDKNLATSCGCGVSFNPKTF